MAVFHVFIDIKHISYHNSMNPCHDDIELFYSHSRRETTNDIDAFYILLCLIVFNVHLWCTSKYIFNQQYL